MLNYDDKGGGVRIETEASRPDRPADKWRSRILVVEGDRDVCLQHNRALIYGGYRADSAENGAVAWSMLQNNHYDLLITDLDMPAVSGVELLEKLNAARIELRVIVFTRQLAEFNFRICPSLQSAVALLKPVTREDLLTAVEKALYSASAVREQVGRSLS